MTGVDADEKKELVRLCNKLGGTVAKKDTASVTPPLTLTLTCRSRSSHPHPHPHPHPNAAPNAAPNPNPSRIPNQLTHIVKGVGSYP